jgi:phytoene dehydrogenase-like protein
MIKKKKVFKLKVFDIAVIGSGIGGSLIASLNAHKNIALFEKDKNLGGCASTFTKGSYIYNTGATSLVGYEEGHILKEQFDELNLKPNIQKNDIAIRVVQNNKTIDRVKDLESYLENINHCFPNKNNKLFWTKIKEIDEKFWKLKKVYYGKYSLQKYIKTASFIAELLQTFGFDLFKSAQNFIKEILGDISKEYQQFIDAQLLITIQTTSKDISLLSMALGLSYPFHDVFYAYGGMGSLIEDITKDIEVKRKEEVQKIIKEKDGFIIQSSLNEYKTKQLVLNSSIYQSAKLFEDKDIQKYYDSFSFSDQSAFVVYLTLDKKYNFLEHYQFIYNETLPNCISNSFFVSFSKHDDEILSKNGTSVTISTHTKANFWKFLDDYKKTKKETQEYIINKFLEYFIELKTENILKKFSATSFTFNRYINRYNCGGKAIGFKNITELPSSNSPFKGLYNVGDTVFAGQGWPGVSIGVDVLNKELNAKS